MVIRRSATPRNDPRRTFRPSSIRWLTALLAVFVLLPVGAPTVDASLRFTDVADSNVFSADIDWLASRAVTSGCNPPDNTRFCPNDFVTRGQMAAFLVRALGLEDGEAHFDDTDGSVFEADIAALAAAGITRGCNPPDNTRFCPDDRVTRGQMAAFLVRALGLTQTGSSFTDTAGSVFETDISRLAAAGVTRGCNPPDNTRFCPDDHVTRGQMAAFLRRALPDLPPVVRPGANLVGATDSTYQPSISDDGRYIAYTIYSESDDSASPEAIRVIDRVTGTHQDLRPGPDGYGFSHPALSGNGEWILTYAHEGDTEELWLVERATGDHHVIDEDLNYGGGQDAVDVDFEGRYVVFTTANPDLMADPAGSSEMFRWDRLTGGYDPLSVDSFGQTPDQGAIGWGRISDDGSRVMFESNQPDMADDTPWHPSIYPTYLYVHDFGSDETELVSRDQASSPLGGVIYSAFSGDGTTVAYEDGDGFVIRTIGSGVLREVPIPGEVQSLNRTALSSDGSVFAYFAELSTSGTYQLYSWDSGTDTTRLLTRSASGEPADEGALANTFFPGRPALSGRGEWVAFTSRSTNLGAPAPGGVVDGEAVAAHVFVSQASPGS